MCIHRKTLQQVKHQAFTMDNVSKLAEVRNDYQYRHIGTEQQFIY